MEDFIQRIKKEIGKGIATVSAKSKEIVDTIRIHNQIGDLKEKRRLTLEETGQIVYRMSQEKDYDGGESIKEKCRLIADLDDQIQFQENELKKVHDETEEAIGKVICESCGTAMDPEAKFCRNCGARLIIVEKKPE